MKEHRKSERFTLKLPARIEMDSGQGRRIFDLQTSNICVGGAFFPTTQPIAEGTRGKIDLLLSLDNKLKTILDKLKLYGQAHIMVKGTVVRSESIGMAVRFDEDYQIIPLQGLSNSGSNP